MFVLGIRYLTGCVVANEFADRDRARVEWPPHPGRVFMALAAAHFQTGEDEEERSALGWLEALPAPRIYAPNYVERPAVTHYVPVIDKAGPSKTPFQSALGLTRDRQPRKFARAWLEEDTVYFVYSNAEAQRHFEALENLCAKVTRIGHSTSLVQMWASQALPDKSPNWLPDENRATAQLRLAVPGTMHDLEWRFNQREIDKFFELKAAAADMSNKKLQNSAKAALRDEFQNQVPVRLWPELTLSHGYAQPPETEQPSASGTVFDPHLLIYSLRRLDGPYRYLDLAATLKVTGRLREAVLQHLGADPSEVLSGHDGASRSEKPHLAFLPLPFVGHEHAHGGILGLALALPRDLDHSSRGRLLRAMAEVRRSGLKLGGLGCWSLEIDDGLSPAALRARSWTAFPTGVQQWATVTPYVLDRHPKTKDKAAYHKELTDAIREAWRRVCHEEVSVEVVITAVSAHLGVPPSHEFPRLARKDGSECRHTHAILIFGRPVVGPVILGAGRYRGYGFCRPL
jgi:CRISPR-associated protein Csb2